MEHSFRPTGYVLNWAEGLIRCFLHCALTSLQRTPYWASGLGGPGVGLLSGHGLQVASGRLNMGGGVVPLSSWVRARNAYARVVRTRKSHLSSNRFHSSNANMGEDGSPIADHKNGSLRTHHCHPSLPWNVSFIVSELFSVSSR